MQERQCQCSNALIFFLSGCALLSAFVWTPCSFKVTRVLFTCHMQNVNGPKSNDLQTSICCVAKCLRTRIQWLTNFNLPCCITLLWTTRPARTPTKLVFFNPGPLHLGSFHLVSPRFRFSILPFAMPLASLDVFAKAISWSNSAATVEMSDITSLEPYLLKGNMQPPRLIRFSKLFICEVISFLIPERGIQAKSSSSCKPFLWHATSIKMIESGYLQEMHDMHVYLAVCEGCDGQSSSGLSPRSTSGEKYQRHQHCY